MRRSRDRAHGVRDVNADGAFTSKTTTFKIPALKEGFSVHGGYPKPHIDGGGTRVEITSNGKSHIVIWHCGRPFHEYTPQYYLTPPPEMFMADEQPCDGETPKQRQAREERNQARAEIRAEWLDGRFHWMYDIHEHPPDGRLRWKCPFHAGKLYNRALVDLPKSRDGAWFGILPEGATRCCSGTFTMSHEDLAPYQEIDFFTPEHALARAQRNPIEGNFGTSRNQGAFDPVKCQAPLLQPRVIASLVAEVVKNLQITMNRKIEDLYRKIEEHQQHANAVKDEQHANAVEYDQHADQERRCASTPTTADPTQSGVERPPGTESDDCSPTPPRPPPSTP